MSPLIPSRFYPRVAVLAVTAIAILSLTLTGPDSPVTVPRTAEPVPPDIAGIESLPAELQSVVDRRLGSRPGVIIPTATGATIDNPVHQVSAVIDERGLAISGALLAVRAWGRDGQTLIPVQTGTVTATSERVVIQRPGLHEVITTSKAGLRHDVVVEERPRGEGDLVVEIACH
jgi:hypothetical protein